MAITELNFEITPNGLQKLAEASKAVPVNLAGMQLFRGQIIGDPLDYSLCSDIETDDPLDVSEPEIVLSPLGGQYDYLSGVMGIEGIDNTSNEYTAKTCCIYWEESGERMIFAIVSQAEIAFTKLTNSALTVTLNFALSPAQSQVITFNYAINHPIASTSWTGAVQLATTAQVAAGQQKDGVSPLVMQAGQGCSLLSRNGSTSPIFSIKEHSIDNVVNISSIGDMLILGCLRIRDFIYFELNYSSLSSTTNIIENGSPTVTFDKIRYWHTLSGNWTLRNPTSATPTIFRQSNYGSNDSVMILSGTGVRGSSTGSIGNRTIVSCRSELGGTFYFEVPLHKVQSGVVMFYALVIGVA